MPGKAFISIRLDMEAIDALQVWEVWISHISVGGVRDVWEGSCLAIHSTLPILSIISSLEAHSK